jgi:hypothetical protein
MSVKIVFDSFNSPNFLDVIGNANIEGSGLNRYITYDTLDGIHVGGDNHKITVYFDAPIPPVQWRGRFRKPISAWVTLTSGNNSAEAIISLANLRDDMVTIYLYVPTNWHLHYKGLLSIAVAYD